MSIKLHVSCLVIAQVFTSGAVINKPKKYFFYLFLVMQVVLPKAGSVSGRFLSNGLNQFSLEKLFKCVIAMN